MYYIYKSLKSFLILFIWLRELTRENERVSSYSVRIVSWRHCATFNSFICEPLPSLNVLVYNIHKDFFTIMMGSDILFRTFPQPPSSCRQAIYKYRFTAHPVVEIISAIKVNLLHFRSYNWVNKGFECDVGLLEWPGPDIRWERWSSPPSTRITRIRSDTNPRNVFLNWDFFLETFILL